MYIAKTLRRKGFRKVPMASKIGSGAAIKPVSAIKPLKMPKVPKIKPMY